MSLDFYGDVDDQEFLKEIPPNLSYQREERARKKWVFWSQSYESRRISISSDFLGWIPETHSNPSLIQQKIKSALCDLRSLGNRLVLIQFWAPVTIGGRLLLTSIDQPFAVGKLLKGYFKYRTHSLSYKFNVDANWECRQEEEEEDRLIIGPPSRVFRNGLPECSPDVRCYSEVEYPLRDLATDCKVSNYLAFPVFGGPSGTRCVGVLEIVCDRTCYVGKYNGNLFDEVRRVVEAVGLKSFNPEEYLKEDKIEGLQHAKEEIKQVLKMVCDQAYLSRIAEAWISYSHSNVVPYNVNMEKSCDSFYLSCTKDMLARKLAGNYFSIFDYYFFGRVSDVHPMRKDQGGLVGKAFLTHKPYFCRDISKFSITEYPLSHYALNSSLNRCFVICLRSTHTKNLDYVLEFFQNTGDSRDAQTWSDSILATMKQHLQSFKVASGEELGDELSVQAVKNSVNDIELNSFKICQTTRYVTSTNVLQSEGELGLLDKSTLPLQSFPSIEFSIQSEHSFHPQNVEPAIVHSHYGAALYPQDDFTGSSKLAFDKFAGNSQCSPPLVEQQDEEGGNADGCRKDLVEQNGKEQSVDDPSSIAEVAALDVDGDPVGTIMPNRAAADCCHDNIEVTPSAPLGPLQTQSGSQNESGDEFDGSSSETNGQNVCAEQINTVATCLEKTHTKRTSETEYRTAKISITREDIEQRFGMKQDDAADSLGVSLSSFKRSCRKNGIERWPAPKRTKVNHPTSIPKKANDIVQDVGKQISEASRRDQLCSDLPPMRVTTAVNQALPNAVPVPVPHACLVTIKATYKDDMIKFQLSLSSGMAELVENLTERMPLKVGTFSIKYQDDDGDWILIINDKDLRLCMSSLRSSTIKMFVQPIIN